MLVWSWSDKCGELTDRYGTVNLYEGNALLIMIKEWTLEDGTEQYQVVSFFCDKEHAKNCLGLSKGHENIYESSPWEKLILYTNKSRNWKVIAEYAVKAFPDIEIVLRAQK